MKPVFSKSLHGSAYYKLIAVESAINLIANTLSLCKFRTYQNGKETKKDVHYMLNVQPNLNQNANSFWRKVIHNLVYNNSCLIVLRNNYLFVADNFNKITGTIYQESKYTNIQINGEMSSEVFSEQDVIYLELNNENMVNIINGMYKDYADLIEFSKRTYKRSNARRGTLEVPTSYPQTPQAQEDLNRLFESNLSSFIGSESDSVLPLTNGLKFQDLTNHTYKNGSDSRDIKLLITDVFDYVAMAFNIPPQLLKGSVADTSGTWDNFITFCIKPLVDLIESELNRKLYTKAEFLNKSYVKIDYHTIRVTWLKDIANAIDILTRNGVNTLDDNLELVGREPVGGRLGETRFTTLNLTEMGVGENKD